MAAGTKNKDHYGQVRDEYASWLAIPPRAKKGAGLPTSKEQFAELKGIASRTLRRWDVDEEFQKLVEQRKVRYANEALPNSAVAKAGRARPATDPRIAKRLSAPDEFEGVEAGERGVVDFATVETQDERDYLAVKNKVIDAALTDENKQAQELYMKLWGRPFIDAELNDDLGLAGMSDSELVREFVLLMGEDATAEVLADFASERIPSL